MSFFSTPPTVVSILPDFFCNKKQYLLTKTKNTLFLLPESINYVISIQFHD